MVFSGSLRQEGHLITAYRRTSSGTGWPAPSSRAFSALALSCLPFHCCQHSAHRHRWRHGSNSTVGELWLQMTQMGRGGRGGAAAADAAAASLSSSRPSILLASLASARSASLALVMSRLKASTSSGERRDDSRCSVRPVSALCSRRSCCCWSVCVFASTAAVASVTVEMSASSCRSLALVLCSISRSCPSDDTESTSPAISS
mmetsp:Transcript_19402/g.55630  ORF Transcript_19402/g.55630 Transcript_19402/m.55630 type:complete len:203 (-) Transcript_19402:192-800(-)